MHTGADTEHIKEKRKWYAQRSYAKHFWRECTNEKDRVHEYDDRQIWKRLDSEIFITILVKHIFSFLKKINCLSQAEFLTLR